MAKKHQLRWRDRKFEESPYCEQCGCELIHPRDCTKIEIKDGKRYSKMIVPVPTNMATLEHDRSRYNPYRWEPNLSNEKRTRLLCVKCNDANNKMDHMKLPKEILNRFGTLKNHCRSERRAHVKRIIIEFYRKNPCNS